MLNNTFIARLGKVEPIWSDELTPEGKKVKVRYLKLSYYCTIADFPDALQWDGAEMYISKQNPELQDNSVSYIVPKTFIDGLKMVVSMVSDLINDAEREKK
ncbi:MAG: hypothetical protein DDT19_02742 [Syntrophomonadaceae bacterium]|nr:hypothetical protein [Bacillota bacterium]